MSLQLHAPSVPNHLLPEPDMEWYVNPQSPSIISRTISNSKKQAGEQDAKLLILLGKIAVLEKNMEKIVEKMEKLETAIVGLQLSNIPTRDLAPPLPPRNKTKQQQQAHPVTHEVSLKIPPGFLIPAKLTDF